MTAVAARNVVGRPGKVWSLMEVLRQLPLEFVPWAVGKEHVLSACWYQPGFLFPTFAIGASPCLYVLIFCLSTCDCTWQTYRGRNTASRRMVGLASLDPAVSILATLILRFFPVHSPFSHRNAGHQSILSIPRS